MLSGISGERMKTETSLSECDCNWLPPQRMRLTCRSKSSVSRLITHCFLFIFLTPGMTNLRLFSRHMTILIRRQIINSIIKNRNLKFIHYLKWTSSEYMTVLHTEWISNMIYGFWKKCRSLKEKKWRFEILVVRSWIQSGDLAVVDFLHRHFLELSCFRFGLLHHLLGLSH